MIQPFRLHSNILLFARLLVGCRAGYSERSFMISHIIQRMFDIWSPARFGAGNIAILDVSVSDIDRMDLVFTRRSTDNVQFCSVTLNTTSTVAVTLRRTHECKDIVKSLDDTKLRVHKYHKNGTSSLIPKAALRLVLAT